MEEVHQGTLVGERRSDQSSQGVLEPSSSSHMNQVVGSFYVPIAGPDQVLKRGIIPFHDEHLINTIEHIWMSHCLIFNDFEA